MHRYLAPAILLSLSACGGGGGGTVAPVTVPVRLQADALDLGPSTSSAELVVRLASETTEAPVLVQATIELPPALTLAAVDRLLPVAALPTLDGEWRDGQFVVICGDAQNAVAAPLPRGPLFRVRLVATSPRQPGTYELRLIELRAAAADGTRLPIDTAPSVVSVTLR